MKFTVMLAGALLVCATTALAQQPQESQPSPEQMKMMEAMMKAGTPGAEHKMLDAFAGTWDTKISAWMAPGAPPMTSTGTSENRWIMGGRYLEQRFRGSFEGMPFEGLGFTGYDNVKKRYWGSWMDNMSTAMMLSTGAASEDGNVFTFTGSMPDPMSGGDTKVDEKITIVDPDHHTMEMWTPGPDGKTFKSMEIVYTRKK